MAGLRQSVADGETVERRQRAAVSKDPEIRTRPLARPPTKGREGPPRSAASVPLDQPRPQRVQAELKREARDLAHFQVMLPRE